MAIRVEIEGKTHKYAEGTSLWEIAKEITERDPQAYPEDIVLAEVDHHLRELGHVAEDGEKIRFLTSVDKNGRRAYRRSLILLMQAAAARLDPDRQMDIRVEHSLGQGYFCHIYSREKDGFHLLSHPQASLIAQLRDQMLAMADEDIPIVKRSVSTEKVRDYFRREGLVDKVSLLRYRMDSHTNLYDLEGVSDYFYGYMVPSTGLLKYFDLQTFADGFMLLFPYREGKKVADFDPAMKLFEVQERSGNWSARLSIPSVGALDDAIASGRIRDIILAQEALMEEQIGSMASRIIDRGRRVVMIAGPSSSGKTTFSHRLGTQLMARGFTPHPFPLDSYYRGRSQVPLDEKGNKDFEALEALDVELFNQNVTDLFAGKRVLLPEYNFTTGKREYHDRYMQLGERDILVIEGIHGLNDKLSYSIPASMKYKIYISALTQLGIDEHNPLSTTDGRLLRRIVRDARTRGTSAAETIRMWDSVRRGEESGIFPFQEMADEMFNSALVYEIGVLKLYAEPLLFAIDKEDPAYAEAHRLLKLLDYFLAIPTEDIANNSLIREFIGGSCFQV